jgi:hypothetical protein
MILWSADLPARKTTNLAADRALRVLPLVTRSRECKGCVVIAESDR